MQVEQRTVWVTTFICRYCKRVEEMFHGKDKPIPQSYPQSGEWNGWDIKNEVCHSCRNAIRNGDGIATPCGSG